MTGFFVAMLSTGITASIAAVIVILLRFVLKGTPRWITCLLWSIVALRLLCPFTLHSNVSLMPEVAVNGGSAYKSAQVESGSATSQSSVTVSFSDSEAFRLQPSENSADFSKISGYVWLCGTGIMLLYFGASYLLTRRQLRESVPLRENIRQSDRVKSPFVLGFISPKIYIPFKLQKKVQRNVLAHEQAHIKRLDHIWKPLGFVLLSLHWYNPVMWISYVLFCRDIEVACDEKVIRDFSINKRKDYARALLECSVSGRSFAYPLAFGEVGVGRRIKKTLRYRKAPMVLVAVSLVMCLAVSMCLLTDPVQAVTEELYMISTDRVTQGYTPYTEPAQSETVPTQPATEPDTSYEVYYEDYTEDYYASDETSEVAYRSWDDIMKEHDEWVQREIIDKNAAIIERNESVNNFGSTSALNGLYASGLSDPYNNYAFNNTSPFGNSTQIFPDPYVNSAINASPFGNQSSGVTSAFRIP